MDLPTVGLTGAEVTVRDGRGFAPAGTALRAIDLVDGHELWHVDHATTHTANILNPASTFTTGSGSAVAMSEFFLDFNLQSPQFGSASGQVRYLDPATGQLLSTSPDASYATPIEANGWTYDPRSRDISGIHAQVHDHTLVATPPSGTGFSVQLPGSAVDVVSDDTTTFVSSSGVTFAVAAHGCGATTCVPLWSTNLGPHLALANGTAYGLAYNGVVNAIGTAGCGSPTCSPTWSSPALTGSIGGIAVDRDHLFVTTGTTLSVFAANGCGAPSCSPVWTTSLGGTLSAPTVVNDVVFAGASDGSLAAWNTAGCGSATCPTIWSQNQGAAVGPVSPISRAIVFPVGGMLRKLVVPNPS